jgi:thiamine transporter
MKVNNKNFKLVFSALMVALSVVLSLFKIELPYGGSITVFSMVPLVLVAQMYGAGWGFLTCTVFGFIKMILGFNNFSYVSGIEAYIIVFLFDYVLAYAVVGLSGVTRKIKNAGFASALGAFIGCALRYACHIVSGLTVWRTYAESWEAPSFISSQLLQPDLLPYTYSVVYNGMYMIPDTIMTMIGGAVFCTIFFEVFKIDVNEKSSKKLKAVAEENIADSDSTESIEEKAAEEPKTEE